MLTELTNNNYNDIISSHKPLVIEFYSPTCAHCRRLEEGLNEVTEEAVIAKCNIATELSLAQRFDITSVPTLLFIKDGDVKDKLIGFTHKLIISENIKKLK